MGNNLVVYLHLQTLFVTHLAREYLNVESDEALLTATVTDLLAIILLYLTISHKDRNELKKAIII